MANLKVKTFVILVVGLMVIAPCVGAQAPQPKVRAIGTIPEADIDEVVRLPNGQVVLYTARDSIFAYELTTKHSTLITGGFDGQLTVSPSGDRIAFDRQAKDRRTDFIVTIPIDPRTGTATGPAQRVSVGGGDSPSFSPDGSLIAFAVEGPSPRTKNDLAVVPATGGPERLLAKYDKFINETYWSADGNWVFIQVGERQSIEGVPAAGGPSEIVISYSGEARGYMIVGSDILISYSGEAEGSIDGQIAFYRPDARAESEGRMAYVTASGAHGEFRIPPGAGWGGRVRSAQSLLTKTTSPSAAHLLNFADGTVRDLLPGTLVSRCPVWSPDSRRLALLQDSTVGPSQLTVMNADGSQPREYPVTLDPTTASMHWSPNGQMLAYYAGAGATTIAVINIATGTMSTVFSAPDATFFNFVWRPDGKAIVLVKGSVKSGEFHRDVYEAGLDGTARKLRDIGAEFPFTMFISDRLLLGAADDPRGLYSVIPSSGGSAQKFPGGTGRVGWPGVSNDGGSLLFLLGNNTPITSVELMTTGGVSLRTLSLPFEVVGGHSSAALNPPFHPDGRHIILFGKTPGESASKIFLVPLDGTTPRVLATLPGTVSNGRLALSPDGRSLVYTLQGAPTSTIYELDVSPILRSIGMR